MCAEKLDNLTSYTGGTSQTVSTTGFGGKLKVRSNNSCGGSGDWSNEIVVGTPYIAGKTVDGGSPQYPNYVSYSAMLNINTDGTATSCDWVIDGGSGSVNPSGSYSCEAIPSPFIRVRAEPSNTYGDGETFTFYIQQASFRGYQMSSNPTKSGDKIRVEFADAKYAEDLVESVVLYSEKEKMIWSLSKEEAKTGKVFKDRNFVEIGTEKLSKGVYYLHLQIADKKYIERLRIE